MFFSLLEWPSCVPGHWVSGDDSNTPLGWVSKGPVQLLAQRQGKHPRKEALPKQKLLIQLSWTLPAQPGPAGWVLA